MKARILGAVLVAIGLSTIIYGLIIRHDALNTQQKIIQEFENEKQKINKIDKGINNVEFSVNKVNNNMDEANDTLVNDDIFLKIEGLDIIGILEIPSIDLKVAVAEGTDKKTLQKAVGHFKGTAMPGETGNFAVAGHRRYTYNEFFNRLNEVKVGDKIKIKTVRTEFVYEVTDIFVVRPHEVWVLDPTPDPTITLVTCTPVRVATHRLIVKGKLQSRSYD